MAFTKVAPAGIGSTPGDGYRIGDSFLHSTGVEITNINATGILTAASLDISGAIDFDGQTNLDHVNIAGVTTITSSTYPLNVHADTAYQGILVNGNNAPTLGFNTGDNATPSWKIGLSGSNHTQLAISEGTGNTNRLSLSSGGGAHLSGALVCLDVGIDGNIYHNSDTDTKLQFGTDTIDLYTGGSIRLRINSSGKLLLGTTTPGYSGGDDLTISTSGDTGMTIRSGTSNQGILAFSDGTSGADEYRGYVQYLHNGNALLFGTDATERFRINSTGQIITNGGSANPFPTRSATFQPPSGQTNCYVSIVAGNTTSVSGLTFGDGADNNAANYAGMFEYRHNVDTLAYMQNGSDRLRIASDGDLTIVGSDNAELKLLCGSSSGNNIIAFQNSGGTTRGNITYDSDNNFLLFNVNQAETMRITSDGRLGINKTSGISAKLNIGDSSNDGALSQLIKLGNDSSGAGTGSQMNLGLAHGNESTSACIAGFLDSAGGTSFSVKTAGTYANQSTVAERFRIDSNGAVMIRTTTAGAHSSDLTIGDAASGTAGRIMIRSASNAGGYINFQDTTGSTVDGALEYNHILNSFNFYFGSQERFRIHTQGMLGLSGANYGTSGQVLTSGGTGSPVSWTTIPAQATIANNANNRVITGGSGVNLNGEANFTYDGNSCTLKGTTDGVLNLDTTDSRGSFIRFKQGGTTKVWVGSGQGLSLGDVDDLGLMATDNIIMRAGSSEKLRITSDGNLGLGIASPVARLHIHNSGTGAADHAYAFFTTGDTGSTASDGLTVGVAANQVASVNYREAGTLTLNTAATERLRINSNGNIQIGTAADPGNALRYVDIGNYNTGGSAGSILRLLTVKSDGSSSTSADIVKYKAGGLVINNNEAIGTTGYISFGTATAGGSTTERLRIASDGTVNCQGTTALKVPTGTTAQRPTGTTGMLRYNTTTEELEAYGSNNFWFNVKDGKFQGEGDIGTSSNPAYSGKQLKDLGKSSGTYYIKPQGYSGSAIQAYVDMTTNGGGWVLVAAFPLQHSGLTMSGNTSGLNESSVKNYATTVPSNNSAAFYNKNFINYLFHQNANGSPYSTYSIAGVHGQSGTGYILWEVRANSSNRISTIDAFKTIYKTNEANNKFDVRYYRNTSTNTLNNYVGRVPSEFNSYANYTYGRGGTSDNANNYHYLIDDITTGYQWAFRENSDDNPGNYNGYDLSNVFIR